MNVASLSPQTVAWVVKAGVLVVLALLAWLCRVPGRDRRHPLAVAELGLVLLGMLLISERSWKAHYVTVLIPYAVLTFWLATRTLTPGRQRLLRAVLIVSLVLITFTAPGMIGSTASNYTEAYGLFMLGGVALFVGLAHIVRWGRAAPSPEPQRDTAPTRS